MALLRTSRLTLRTRQQDHKKNLDRTATHRNSTRGRLLFCFDARVTLSTFHDIAGRAGGLQHLYAALSLKFANAPAKLTEYVRISVQLHGQVLKARGRE
eukprot:TRINITY_DN9822_c0_g1_i1.p1 TRINITY_DN9822_c0_g1~~TRINITY_DN9822_c0_g1_i1.p1  ORF type:complete len:106 (-),score=0.99 TRINITY_DN9822_c0_g1_i1:234-530(-)